MYHWFVIFLNMAEFPLMVCAFDKIVVTEHSKDMNLVWYTLCLFLTHVECAVQINTRIDVAGVAAAKLNIQYGDQTSTGSLV